MKKLSARDQVGEYFGDFFRENLSYKLVSLFIAIILWLTILGRRDFVLNRVMDVEVLAGAGQVITAQSVDKVRVKVVGPRTALRKFADSSLSQQITLDSTQLSEGEHEIEIPYNKIDVPFGVKVLQVRPTSVRVLIKRSP